MIVAVHESLSERLTVITRIGKLMLQGGAATFRTAEIMQRVGIALAIETLDVFITPTGMMITLTDGEQVLTRTFKVPSIGVNMARISALERLSRRLSIPVSAADLSSQITDIEQCRPLYSPLLTILAVGIACGAFAILLGGSTLEFIAAAGGAMVAQWLRFRLLAARINPFLLTALCAACATLISGVLVRMIGAPVPRVALIASVLLLVPGIPFITSVLDLIHLDLISGVTRGTYAMLLLVHIGIGMLVGLTLTGIGIF